MNEELESAKQARDSEIAKVGKWMAIADIYLRERNEAQAARAKLEARYVGNRTPCNHLKQFTFGVIGGFTESCMACEVAALESDLESTRQQLKAELEHRDLVDKQCVDKLAALEAERAKWEEGCRVNADCAKDALRAGDEQRLKIKALEAKLARAIQLYEAAKIDAVAELRSRQEYQQAAFDLKSKLAEAGSKNDLLRRELFSHREKAQGNYWAWQGGGENFLESLVCPVLIHAKDLKAIVDKLAEERERLSDALESIALSTEDCPHAKQIARAALAPAPED